ncbi:mRNA cleavage and polyadenylation factor subunit [Ceratobasidium sp. 395]|nr:mRNA cleavage and polyadenylation factor subunit [Ceratobasidium sp. 395]
MATSKDGLDRLTVSSEDATIAPPDWSDVAYGLITVSIHTYKRATEVTTNDNVHFRSLLRVDPLYCSAALLLALGGLALLPFYQTQAELDILEQEQTERAAPYSPSFVFDLPTDVESRIKHVINVAFLPGFNNPLSKYCINRDSVAQANHLAHHIPPHDAQTLTPCPSTLGVVLVTTLNAILHVDQSGGVVGRAVDGWSAHVSPLTSIAAPYTLAMGTGPEGVDLNRASVTWMSGEETEAARFLPNGSVRSVQVEREGRVVHALSMGPELGGRVAKAERGAVCVFGERYGFGFIGSVDAESVLVRVVGGIGAKAEDEPEESDEDMGDEDDLYGDANAPTTVKAGTALQPITGFAGIDTLPAYGEINSMVFSLAKNGDRYSPELVVCTGAEHVGGFTLFQKDLPSRTKRKVPAIGGARGPWPIALRTKSSGPGELDTVVVSTDLAPSPGISWIAKTSGGTAGDVQTLARTPGLTMAAGPLVQQGCIARIITNSILLLEPDGAGRQLYLDADGNKPPGITGVSHA